LILSFIESKDSLSYGRREIWMTFLSTYLLSSFSSDLHDHESAPSARPSGSASEKHFSIDLIYYIVVQRTIIVKFKGSEAVKGIFIESVPFTEDTKINGIMVRGFPKVIRILNTPGGNSLPTAKVSCHFSSPEELRQKIVL